ncbi:MAG: hypothetical protein ACYS5W_19575 [Planctomycetota bacterium]
MVLLSTIWSMSVMPHWRAVLTRLSWVAIAVLAVVTPIELLVRAHDYPVRGEGSFVREVESGKPHITDPVIGYLTESELDLSRPLQVEMFYLAQYALVPTLLDHRSKHKILLINCGNDTQLERLLKGKEKDYEMIQHLRPGTVLVRARATGR